MSATIPDVYVDDTAWVDIYTITGITVGDPLNIVNKSVTWCRLYEGNIAPALGVTDGDLISNYDKGYATAEVKAGSLKIWALSTQAGRSLKLAVKAI
ncbi:hypothetical protein NVP1063O_024 [Vibrio phage 1.063.O._10N.261.45.C7]|nr:hypothetical protein NVP1063O_024 [Vibrio phage 1.063.O._10N.261.45.C7]